MSKYNVGYGFHLSLYSRDIQLIETIRKNLNSIGTIYVYKNRDECKLALNDKASLLYLINNIFDVYNFKTINQIYR